MDKKWCRMLAGSRYDGSKWILAHYHQPSYQEKLDRALSEIRYATYEAVEIFNHYSPSEAQITAMDMENAGVLTGLILFRYTTQIRLMRQDNHLLMTLIETKSYQPKSLGETLLEAKEDELGGVVWLTPSGQLWDEEPLVKSIIKELVKHSQGGSLG